MFVLGPYTNAKFTHSILPVTCGDEKRRPGNNIHNDGGSFHRSEQVQAIIEDDGRISVTFRDARSFLDVKSQRLFGQGLISSFETPILVEDGMITNDSLSKAVMRVRDADAKDRKSSMLVAAAIGFVVGYSAWEEKRNTIKESISMNCAVRMSIVTTASYWYMRYLKNAKRRMCEEKDAREFFSKKSASGNKYS